ncbi:MAG: OmpA family protein [Bacteroidota bacterium]
MMRGYLSLFFHIICSWSIAQLQFQNVAEPLDSLNSQTGQNYLIVDFWNERIGFAEETLENSYGQPEFAEVVISPKQVLQAIIFSNDPRGGRKRIPLGFDEEGRVLFSETLVQQGIYKSSIYRSSRNFTATDPESIRYFSSKGPFVTGHLSKDEQYLIISAEGNYTKGVEDLYVIKKGIDGAWGSMINLGNQVNSERQEITPYLAVDNRTLFFASNGHGGEGSYDIFYSERLDESWRNWSKPRNLGTMINTSGAETSFAFKSDDAYAYFVRSSDSDGYGDIFRIAIRDDITPDTTTSIVSKTQTIVFENNEKSLQVLDFETKKPISAELVYGRYAISNDEGIFLLDSIFEKKIEVKSKGYLPAVINPDSLSETKNTVFLNSIAKGKTVKLESVLFIRGTSELIQGTESDLDLVIEVMKENPDLKILIKGHTDNQGDPVKNVELSEDRVRTVKKYITKGGISPYRIKGKGYGGNSPVSSNATETTRRLNRRVEFEVLDD